MRSLTARLSSGLFIALLIVFAVQWLLVSLVIRNVTEDYIATRMTRDAERLLAALTFDESGSPLLTNQPPGLYSSGPFSGQYFQIRIGDDILRSESVWDQTLPIPQLQTGETVRQRMSGPLDQTLLVLNLGFQKQGRDITISVAEDISAVDAGIATFQQRYLLYSISLMLLLLLFQWWIVRSSLGALSNTRLDLERITRGETEKLPENVPSEIRPLVREINLLLDLLSHRLNRTRTAIGNLAHKLKTPLSLLSQLADDGTIREHARQRLRQQTDVMRGALERELGRARLAGDGKAGRRFKPGPDLSSLVEILEHVYQDKGVVIDLDCRSNAGWPADREDMLELFGNLLDNASKWSGGRVLVRVLDNYHVSIEDDGPGSPPEQIQSLRRRGEKLDETVDGHGLGLSIAHDIVDFYAGSLSFDRSPELGGLRVRVELAGSEAGA